MGTWDSDFDSRSSTGPHPASSHQAARVERWEMDSALYQWRTGIPADMLVMKVLEAASMLAVLKSDKAGRTLANVRHI